GKTIDRLEQLGYAERVTDARDARRKLVRLTPLGIDALARSAAIFEDLRAQGASRLGPERLRQLEADLRTMGPHGRFPLDAPASTSPAGAGPRPAGHHGNGPVPGPPGTRATAVRRAGFATVLAAADRTDRGWTGDHGHGQRGPGAAGSDRTADRCGDLPGRRA